MTTNQLAIEIDHIQRNMVRVIMTAPKRPEETPEVYFRKAARAAGPWPPHSVRQCIRAALWHYNLLRDKSQHMGGEAVPLAGPRVFCTAKPGKAPPHARCSADGMTGCITH